MPTNCHFPSDFTSRILKTRTALISAMQTAQQTTDDILPAIDLSLPDIPFTMSDEPRLYVRDDGLADWDGALQDRAAMRAFGTAVWARINGMDPDSVSEDDDGDITKHHEKSPAVTAKIEDTEQIRQLRLKLEILQNELQIMETDHTALLKSGMSVL